MVSAGMAEVLLPGLMPQEWRALVASCWAPKPEDRPTLPKLQRHLVGLQQRLRASRATASRGQLAPGPPSCTGLPSRGEPSPSSSAAVGAGRPVVLPKLLQGLDQWMPAPSVLFEPLASESTSMDGQSVHSMQRLDRAEAERAAAGEARGSIAAVHMHARRLPPSRGDSASDSSWSWAASLKGRSAAVQAAVSKGMADVSAKAAHVMQQLADTQLSAKSGNTDTTSGSALF